MQMQQLSGVDASFLYYERPNAPGHVFSLLIYDPSTAPGGKVTFKGILEHYAQRLHTAAAFRQKLVQVPFGLDHPYWVRDADFDLEFHVRHIALPEPGDWRQLCIQVARLHSRALDMNRPLWEATVIEGLDNVEGVPPGSFAVMQKTHHAAIDGVTMVEIVSATHDTEPDATPPTPTETWQPEADPTPWELLARAAANNATRPMRFARLLARSAPGGGQVQEQFLRQRLQLPAATAAPRTRFSGPVSGHRTFDGRRYPLDEIRRIKAAVPGATVNDAVIALVGGGLRHYLSDKGELPSESLRVMAPISVRTPEQAGTGGNQVSAMVATLGTDIADGRQRLEAVRESTRASKALSEAIDARTLSELSEFVPGGLAAVGARMASQFQVATRTTPVVNTVVSNVPGPQVPLYFAGARLVTLFGGAAVVDGMGLMHGVSSYCGEVMLSGVSDRDMMPDPAMYAASLDRSFDELAAATR
jgi:WS/DGAT/MGAT family acyltransferase